MAEVSCRKFQWRSGIFISQGNFDEPPTSTSKSDEKEWQDVNEHLVKAEETKPLNSEKSGLHDIDEVIEVFNLHFQIGD